MGVEAGEEGLRRCVSMKTRYGGLKTLRVFLPPFLLDDPPLPEQNPDVG